MAAPITQTNFVHVPRQYEEDSYRQLIMRDNPRLYTRCSEMLFAGANPYVGPEVSGNNRLGRPPWIAGTPVFVDSLIRTSSNQAVWFPGDADGINGFHIDAGYGSAGGHISWSSGHMECWVKLDPVIEYDVTRTDIVGLGLLAAGGYGLFDARNAGPLGPYERNACNANLFIATAATADYFDFDCEPGDLCAIAQWQLRDGFVYSDYKAIWSTNRKLTDSKRHYIAFETARSGSGLGAAVAVRVWVDDEIVRSVLANEIAVQTGSGFGSVSSPATSGVGVGIYTGFECPMATWDEVAIYGGNGDKVLPDERIRARWEFGNGRF